MKTKYPLIIGLIAAATFVGCGKTESTPAPAKDQPAAAAPAAGEKTAAVKPYPLTTCLVSGEKLGSMGEPIVLNHKGQEIKFCCKQCQPDFEKNPDKYLAKLPK
jgi:YHS domain-containing protein